MTHQALSAFIEAIANLLRGNYKQAEYGKVILPFTVLRRLDCVLASTKSEVLAEYKDKQAKGIPYDAFLKAKSGQGFYNICELDLAKLLGDPDCIQGNLCAYIQGFSEEVRDIFERFFEIQLQVDRLAKEGLLYLVTEKFNQVDLHPDKVGNDQMGMVFEELIRKYAEVSNETAGEHFTPRDVIWLMVHLLFCTESEVLTAGKSVVRTLYDPTAGTGGMLSIAEEYLQAHNPNARLILYGQELNKESYGICKSDMLIKGQDIGNIIAGNTLSADGHPNEKFDYMLSNPPFGGEWKKVEKEVRKEYEGKGFDGRFGPGLPRVSDGSMLFLLHLISKMRPQKDGGSRFGIVLNGSPLFTGPAGSGESEIRRYVLENDLVEAIIGLPSEMFYNTGISTYIWIVSNNKSPQRKGKIQLIDGTSMGQKMRKSLGNKRKEVGEEQRSEITRLYGEFVEADLLTTQDGEGQESSQLQVLIKGSEESGQTDQKVKCVPISRIFRNEDFGYRTVTVERPLRDEKGNVLLATKGKQKGKPQADTSLRDSENIPLNEDIHEYFKREVLPHVPDAWIDEEKTKVGYEIPFNRHFYVFEPPRELAEIDVDLKAVTERILEMLGGVAK